MTTFYGASSLFFFIIAQEKPLSLACLTIIQNEEMEINMNSDSKYNSQVCGRNPMVFVFNDIFLSVP